MRLSTATKVGKKTKTAKKKQKKALENRVLTRQPSPPATHSGEHPGSSSQPLVDVDGTRHTSHPPRSGFALPSPHGWDLSCRLRPSPCYPATPAATSASCKSDIYTAAKNRTLFFYHARQLTIKDVANHAPGSGGGSARATANGAERSEDTGGGETGRGGVRGTATTKQI